MFLCANYPNFQGRVTNWVCIYIPSYGCINTCMNKKINWTWLPHLKISNKISFHPPSSQNSVENLVNPPTTWLYVVVWHCIWLYMVVHGCSWLLMVVQGCSWLYMVVHCFTMYMVVHGCTWLYMIVHCCTWLYIVVHCCTWSYMVLQL